MPTCRACGRENPSEAVYCMYCAAALQATKKEQEQSSLSSTSSKMDTRRAGSRSSAKAEALIEMGEKVMGSGDYKKADEYFSKALALDLKNIRAWNYRGLAFIRQLEYFKAIKCFNKALILDSENDIANEGKRLCMKNIREQGYDESDLMDDLFEVI